MNCARFSVDNRVFVHVAFLLLAALGVLAFSSTTVEVYPDVSFDAAQIIVAWPGASPEEVETSVVRDIEEKIRDVKGIDRIVSSSERDRGLIDVKFREDASEDEFNRGFEDLRAQVARVTDLPEGCERPEIRKITVNELYPLLQVVVAADRGEVPMAELRAVARRVRERIRRVDGILRVSDIGIPAREWRILVRRDALDAAGLDLLGVADRLRARHRDVPAGTVEGGDASFAVTAGGEFRDRDQLREAIVGWRADASPVRLGEIADVADGFEKPVHLNRWNGRACINLSVAKREDADSLAIREEVGRILARIPAEERLPEGIGLHVGVDTTRILETRLDVLKGNLASGLVLVFLTMWPLLGFRNSALALIGIPSAYLCAFSILWLMGVSINAITIFSLLLVSGMDVDDAIVVIENIHRRVQEGWPLRQAVIDGAREVAWPVVSACATTLAAFLPMLIMQGVVGEFMGIIPKTVAAVLVASLIECLFLLPTHYLSFGERRPARGLVRAANALFDRVGGWYTRVLARTLERPLLVVGANLLLAGGAVLLYGRLPVDMFPSDFQAFYCNVFADPEYGLERTAEAVRDVEAEIAGMMPDQVENFTTSVGACFTDDNQLLLKPSVAQILVYASESWTRNHDSQELIAEVRRRTEALVRAGGRHRFVRIKVDTFQDGPPVGKPVAVRVAAADYDRGKAVAREIQDRLGAMPGVLSVSDNLDEGPRESRIVPDPVRLDRAGIPFAEAGRLVLAANDGLEIGDVVPDGDDEDVKLRILLRPEDRTAPADLLRLSLRGPDGRPATLGDVAGIVVRRAPASLYHYDGDRVVLVTADLDEDVTDSLAVNSALLETVPGFEARNPGITITCGGEFEETKKSFASLFRAFGLAVVLIYAVLAAQFRSYAIPLVVMTVVPFSYVGVVYGLWLLGFPMTIMAFIAVVGLSGVVVNNAIVLVDFIEGARREGRDLRPAILHGSRTRLRPIVLTTVTTVLGLLPMAVGFPGYSRIWSPFSATISFGLSLAMVLTLFLIPAVYLLLDRRRRRPDPAPNPGEA